MGRRPRLGRQQRLEHGDQDRRDPDRQPPGRGQGHQHRARGVRLPRGADRRAARHARHRSRGGAAHRLDHAAAHPRQREPDPGLLPRDSYVEIPGRGRNKINASYSIGGPKLLNQTVEAATGLRVDGYMEIGFGGFASVVDSVGGVEMCLDKPMKDVKAAIDLPAGCQTLDGKNALGYVRARYSDPLGDLGRAQRQREFLGALMNKMATPANLLNPVKLRSMGTSGAQGVAVDNDMSPYGALKIMLALRKISNGSGQSVQVPVADSNYQTRSGDAVLWDAARSQALFGALNNDESPNVAP
ncbi:LCP family protein [Barrientosiimonas endolithica]|uniref:LCP family protein n=1 Tax=Barrientosiimonas endolithica TaxID=1535208 RepID=UPI00259AF696|nr:LCP family protein [Barrientosiimonas endolithica]